MTLELAAGADRLALDPSAGGRAVSWQAEGMELLGAADQRGAGRAPTPIEHGMYVMAPWPGRLRGNQVSHDGRSHVMPVTTAGWALHGTVVDRAWQVDQPAARAGGAAAAVLSVQIGPGWDAWPWPGQVRASWQLRPGQLELSVQVHTRGDAFPAGVGWHPWLRRRLGRGGAAVLDVPDEGMLERGQDYLPTGRVLRPRPVGPYDDAFALPSGRFTVTWPGALDLTCRTDTAWVVVFDEHDGAVCVEPQTGPPDGVNTSPDLVTAGVPLSARSTWTWTQPG